MISALFDEALKDIRRYIHCFLGATIPLLGVWARLDTLPLPSTNIESPTDAKMMMENPLTRV